MASFQAKIGWKWLRKRENKNYRSVTQVGKGREREKIKIIVSFRFYPTGQRKFQKNSKKIQQISKYDCGIISSQNRLEKAEKDRKQILSFRYVPTRRVIENSKKIKNTIMASFQAKICWKGLRKRENKNSHSVTQVGKGRDREKI